METQTILVLSNDNFSTYIFRIELMKKLVETGLRVVLSVPSGSKNEDFKNAGIDIIDTQLNRRGTNPFDDYKLYKFYKKIIKDINPNIVLTFTIKPNIYGGLAAKKINVPYIANITGLGTAVENPGLLQKIITFLYKRSFKKINHVFFQNHYNLYFFQNNKIIKNNYFVLPGSGVNLEKFYCLEYPKEKTKIEISYIGRLMTNKGTSELLKAIEVLNNNNLLFNIAGSSEEDYKNEIFNLELKGLLKFHGHLDNVNKLLTESHAIINPSYHEGMSNVLLEAAASARPVLASNIPGCIETFDDGISGIAFEPRNVDSMINAINKFLSMTYEERKQMGLKGREKVEKKFDRNIVVNAYIEKINEILKEND